MSTLARLMLATLFFFQTVSAKAVSNPNFNDKIVVTDFKYYRKISYKKQLLLIRKKSEVQSINYVSDYNEQSIIKHNNQTQLAFKTENKKSNLKIQLDNNKLSFILRQKHEYFAEAASICDKKSLDDLVLKLDSKSFMRSLSSVNVEPLIDNTCSAEQKQKMTSYISDILTSENAWLSKCYNNESVNKLIEADPNYLAYSGSVYAKYLRLVEKVNNNENPIQISCKIDQKNRVGLFDESKTPQKISFNWDELKKNSDSEDKLSENIKTTLGHELFHYGDQMQTPEDTANSYCINESYARVFTDVCLSAENSKESLRNLKIPSGESINATCKKQKEILLDKKNSEKSLLVEGKSKKSFSDSGTGIVAPGLPAYQALQAQQSLQNPQQQAAIQKDLQQTVTQKDFVPVSDTTYAKLLADTTAGTQDGKSYTVSANSDFGKVVQSTLNSFSSSGSTLTSKLNTAVGAATSTAQAQTQTLASATSNTTAAETTKAAATINSRMPAGSFDTEAKAAITTEVSNTNSDTNIQKSQAMSAVANNESAYETVSTSKSSSNTNNGKINTSETSTGASAMASPGSTMNQNSNRNPSLNQKTGSNVSASTTVTTGSMQSIGGNNSANAAATTTTGTASRSIASIPSTVSSNGSSIVKSIQSLKAFNTVSGSQYQEVKKYYSDSKFKNLLETYDMRIMVRNEQGSYSALGVNSDKAKKVFTDDGQTLKALESKK